MIDNKFEMLANKLLTVKTQKFTSNKSDSARYDPEKVSANAEAGFFPTTSVNARGAFRREGPLPSSVRFTLLQRTRITLVAYTACFCSTTTTKTECFFDPLVRLTAVLNKFE